MRLVLVQALSLMLLTAAAQASCPVQISEFAAAGHQGLRDEDGDSPDWIELQNVSTQAVDLAGWTLSEESHRHRSWNFPSTNLPPGQFLVLFASGKDRATPGQPLHASFRLPVSGGVLALHSPSGEQSRIGPYSQQVAGVTYGLSGGGPTNATYLVTATPGRSNSLAIHLGPRVEWVARQPNGSIAAGQPLTVTAKVSPADKPIAAVELCCRVMFGREFVVPMVDDGQHGDGAAQDGVYGAIIPANVAKPGLMIRYYVRAKDAAERSSRWPLLADRPKYSAYEGTVVDQPSVETGLPVLQLFTSSAGGGGGRTGQTGICLFYDGELFDNVVLRPHGQISRGFPKPSFNIDLPRDHHLRPKPGLARVNKIKLLSNFADKSKIRNTLAYEMIAASGCDCHFAFPVRVQHNGRFHSIAEVVENGDERWLERIGRDPQGALYKMDENLSWGRQAEKKTRKYEDGRDLVSFARALSEDRPLEQRATYAYEHIDIPQCVSYFVAMALISSDDHGHKNYYLYHDNRRTGEWALLPWDVDLSWGRNWTGQYFNETIYTDNPLDLYRDGRHKARNRLYNLFFQYPEFRQMYLRRLRTVMDELLQPPGTPPEQLIIEKRVRALMDLLDPPDIHPSDAAADDAGGTAWGHPATMREEAQRIVDEYLPGRRKFLFNSPRAKLGGDAIPSGQPRELRLTLAPGNPGLDPGDQFVRVTNTNGFAVDLTGWHLTGAGVEHKFRPGTVIPPGKALSVVADVAQFRKQPPTSAGARPLFVQGEWKGKLGSVLGPVRVLDTDGRVVGEISPE